MDDVLATSDAENVRQWPWFATERGLPGPSRRAAAPGSRRTGERVFKVLSEWDGHSGRMQSINSVFARVLALAAGALAFGSLGGCGGSSSAAPKAKHAVQARFVAGDFGLPGRGSNRFLPLKPGLQWVRVGGTDVGHRRVPHRVIVTVTGITRLIDGVRAVAVLDKDIDAGQLAQYSIDYLAEDRTGAVWSMGSYTEDYEGGKFVSVNDAWLAGVGGGAPGKLMLADPRQGSPFYSIARPPGADPDVAQVVKAGQHVCVTLRCFDGVLVIREGKASAPDNEFKYYAPGVGQILNTPRSASRHHDVEQLVNVTRLSPRGLAEINALTLRLDRHAQMTKPHVFGVTPPAQRTL